MSAPLRPWLVTGDGIRARRFTHLDTAHRFMRTSLAPGMALSTPYFAGDLTCAVLDDDGWLRVQYYGNSPYMDRAEKLMQLLSAHAIDFYLPWDPCNTCPARCVSVRCVPQPPTA